MPVQLVALDNGPSILLDKPILLLGRHPECDIQIDSRKISRRHCCIAQIGDYLVIRDLGSTNGIRINGVRTIEGRLNPGDELTIGHYRYKVVWEAVAASATPSSFAPPSPPSGKEGKAKRTPIKPSVQEATPRANIEDEILESCDEPVTLEEPQVKVVSPPSPDQPSVPKSPAPVKGKASRLSDEIRRLSNSELFRKDSPLASPSGSHSPV